MAKAKKQKKRSLSRTKARKRVGVLRTRKNNLTSENIFDSKLGKTDALFVDKPNEILPLDLDNTISLSGADSQLQPDQQIPWWKKLFSK